LATARQPANRIDLREPATPADVTTIEAGMDRFAVLVFHDQPIDDGQQVAFSRNFGMLEQVKYKNRAIPRARRLIGFAIRTVRNNLKRLRHAGGQARKLKRRRLSSEFEDISNLDGYGQVLGRTDIARLSMLRNMLWHSDSSFKPIAAKYSLLHARVIPFSGGETEFADMRAAYDGLRDTTNKAIQNLVCEHSQVYSYGALGVIRRDVDSPPVPQRLVRRHPATGRRSLFLSSHAGDIIGWPTPEARLLLRDLTEHATQREFVHVHKWRRYDLVMWDNRVVMHRARPYDVNDARELHRTTVADIAPTLQAA
jgi:alpha-ketoglutarate-dependent 2,4-dichlorophenoxyacetate dioxygenase